MMTRGHLWQVTKTFFADLYVVVNARSFSCSLFWSRGSHMSFRLGPEFSWKPHSGPFSSPFTVQGLVIG
jgi:hypothetical protein